jgi:bifunctional ADP-heptose synthase (sugar kinase/adenylyltransferase)
VISVLTLAYLDGLNDGNAAELANRAGGAVCGVVGVSPVTYSMLQKELSVESFL